MSNLTEQKAEKIITRGLESCERTVDYYEYGEAKGYLFRCSQDKVLVEALERIAERRLNGEFLVSGDMQTLSIETLKRFRKGQQ